METPLTWPHGLIFDLDGTLVDTVAARIEGWLAAFRGAGIAAERAQIAPLIGMDGKRLAQEVAGAVGRKLSDDELERIDLAAGEAFDQLNRAPRALPGVHEAIAAIEASGLRWVIATSSRKEQVATSVAALGLDREPVIVDGSQVEHAKPAPDLLLLAAKRLGARPAGCWAIGDSTWDMRGSEAAGMTGIGVLAGAAVDREALLEAGAALVVATLFGLAWLLREPGSRFGDPSISARAAAPPRE